MREGLPRPLLPHIPEHQRSPLMNRFLDAIRSRGITTPSEIVKFVVAGLRQDLQRRSRWSHAADLRPLRETLLAVIGHPTEAEALAREAVEYEQLPAAEKERRKAAKAEQGRQTYMATLPPTKKQPNYLRRLGVASAPAHRLEASQLIDARLRKGVEE
jgi:hypothetical protein